VDDAHIAPKRAAAGLPFVREHTVLSHTVLVPEIEIVLAREPFGIFQAAEKAEAERPYWAFAWSGGQALARWILDHPEVVAGLRVHDVGSGSALTAIAARLAGAARVVAADTDRLACIAAGINATANDVEIETTADDLLGTDIDTDVIVIGDLFYEPELVTRVSAFLERARRRGIPVLFGDRVTSRRPPLELVQLAEYEAELTPHLEIGYVDRARVWRVGPLNGRRR
jgi:predicted nicotinamide N-methyase